MGEIVPPIVVDNEHPAEELSFYASVEALVGHLEPWYVTDERFVAYDSEGRLLTLGVERNGVTVAAAEDEPRHAPDLRAALASFLTSKGLPSRFTENASLLELRREVMRHGWVVGD